MSMMVWSAASLSASSLTRVCRFRRGRNRNFVRRTPVSGEKSAGQDSQQEHKIPKSGLLPVKTKRFQLAGNQYRTKVAQVLEIPNTLLPASKSAGTIRQMIGADTNQGQSAVSQGLVMSQARPGWRPCRRSHNAATSASISSQVL